MHSEDDMVTHVYDTTYESVREKELIRLSCGEFDWEGTTLKRYFDDVGQNWPKKSLCFPLLLKFVFQIVMELICLDSMICFRALLALLGRKQNTKYM
jgi:hypothetical protein